MSYIKLDLDLLEEIGDFRQCGIICFLFGQDKNKENVRVQKWQQTTLAKLFKCTSRTIYNDLTKLQNNGWLTYKQSVYNNLTTTEITLTEKALDYKVDDQQSNKKETASANKHNISNESSQHTQPSQLSNREKHLLHIKQMMEKEEINN